MPYSGYQPMQPQNNNWWFGNNYASGNSQMSRSSMQPNMGMSNPPIQTPQPMSPVANPMAQQPPQTMNNVLQVMGPESADAFQIGPNSRVILMDSNRPVFYMKRSDDSGFSETKAYAFQEIPLYPEVEQAQPVVDPSVKYVTVDEFDERMKVLEDLVMKNE